MLNKLLIILVLIFSSTIIAEEKMKKVLDKFNDKVKMVKETEEGVRLHFETHAAFYKVNKSNPSFEQLKNKIKKSMSEKKEISVVAEIPSMEITSID